MVLTPSKMIGLGTPASDFSLEDVVSGRQVSLSDFPQGKPLLVIFMCAHCPYVKYLEKELTALVNEFVDQGMGAVAISANDVANYPEDSPEKLRAQAETVGFQFPYLFDGDQSVAKAYQATCTPDFFLFDGQHRLAYRGQFDNSRPGNDIPITGEHLRLAMEAVMAGQPVPGEQHPSVGCNIKWKATKA